jgi:hypothetical protein
VTRRRLAVQFLLLAIPLWGCTSLPARDELLSSPGPQSTLQAGRPIQDGRARFREIFCRVLVRHAASGGQERACSDWLWQLEDEPSTEAQPLPEPDLAPQVYLVSGAFSECLGDEARPFSGAARTLSAAGYRIAAIAVSGRSGSRHNAQQIAERLEHAPPGEEGPVILIGYSKGANDILEFLASYPGAAARVESVVSVAGAIGGSPLAETARGFYDAMLSWIPSGRCPAGDGDVIESLRPQERREWLAQNPLPDSVRYYSVAAFTTRPRVAEALLPSWKLLLRHERRNDGQLLAGDALIPGSTLLGYVDADHWSAAIDVESVHPVLGARPDPTPFPRAALLEAILLQVGEGRARAKP